MSLLVESLGRGLIVTAATLALSVVPAFRRPRIRIHLFRLGLVFVLALPAWVAWAPRIPFPILPNTAIGSPLAPRPRISFAEPSRSEAAIPPSTIAAPPERSPRSPGIAIDLVVAAYLTVASALLAATAIARWRIRALVGRTGRPVPPRVARSAQRAARRLGIAWVPELRMVPAATVPCVAGVWSSTILFPDDIDRWPDHELHAVLAHELAHVGQRDGLVRLVADIACAFHWANPLIWWLARRWREEAELACDRAVVASGVDAGSYAEQLLHLARVQRGAPVLRMATGAVGGAGLRHRIEAVLEPAPPVSWRWTALAGGLAACLGLGAGSITLVAQDPRGGLASLNVSDGGPDVSSNGAGLQARWSEHGLHAALFITGAVDFREIEQDRLGGDGQLLLVQESPAGIVVFEWKTGMERLVPERARASLRTGVRQLQRLRGEHRATLPGSTLSGLPAWSDDPTAHLIQAGWTEGRTRMGLVLRGEWTISSGELTTVDPKAWLVLFSYHTRSGELRRLELGPDAGGGSGGGEGGRLKALAATDGAERAADPAMTRWAAQAVARLARNAPPDVEVLRP